MKHFLVNGLFYGDEGKGRVVSYLPQLTDASNILVIRYNGGAQAAHHVVDPKSEKTVRFSQIGSIIPDRPTETYLGPAFIMNPILLQKELANLRNLGYDTKVTVDPKALIATHYHISENISSSTAGTTCGMGIGEARKYWLQYGNDAIFAGDLCSESTLFTKLELMRYRYQSDEWVPPRVYLDSICFERRTLRECPPDTSLIFEGSQGALLDENHGTGPIDCRTWSNTTMFHAFQLMDRMNIDHQNVRKIGVMRPYISRHGNGPLPRSLVDYSAFELDNCQNRFQGKMRYSEFDGSLFQTSLSLPNMEVDEIALTCCDHVDKATLDFVRPLISQRVPLGIESHGRSTEIFETASKTNQRTVSPTFSTMSS